MEPASPDSAGVLSAVRALADGLLAGAQDRLELLAVEGAAVEAGARLVVVG